MLQTAAFPKFCCNSVPGVVFIRATVNIFQHHQTAGFPRLHCDRGMETAAALLRLSGAPNPILSNLPSSAPVLCPNSLEKIKLSTCPVFCRSKNAEEQELYGLPKEYYDDEWQAQQREKTKELHRKRQEEEEEEERKVEEYREIGLRLKDYPQEDVVKAKKLVSDFIKSAEEVEEKIEQAAEKGDLNEIVLMVIWNRLDLARRDDEKDAVRSLDLLYRRVETEILKREATPAMRLLNDLLNMHDGFDDQNWLKACKKRMVDTFPREDPFTILAPAGFDIDKHGGPLAPAMPIKADNVLLRVDFVREVAALLQEVRSLHNEAQNEQGLDAESVANRLKQQEKQRAIHQVESLLDLAINLNW